MGSLSIQLVQKVPSKQPYLVARVKLARLKLVDLNVLIILDHFVKVYCQGIYPIYRNLRSLLGQAVDCWNFAILRWISLVRASEL